MKIVFAGTPDFAAHALAALMATGHEIALVLTQPDRPSGRGMHVQAGPVKKLAQARAIPVLQPAGLRLGGRYDADARATHARLQKTPHDVMVVAAYGLILPSSILAIPRYGCINIHASLLPRWRGAAPIQRAIEAGDHKTGITIMQMDAGLDTGAILLSREIAISCTDTAATLTDALSRLGGDAIVEALSLIECGKVHPTPQHAPGDESRVTYAAKLSKTEAALDFTLATSVLVNRIRAFNPWPGCAAVLSDGGLRTPFKIWAARPVSPIMRSMLPFAASVVPGQVLGFIDAQTNGHPGVDAGLAVATGDGAIELTEMQKPGGKRQSAHLFEREFTGSPGPLFFDQHL